MKVTRRRFVEALAAVGALSRLVYPARKPATVLSVERSGEFVPIAEIEPIEMTGLHELGPIEITGTWDDA